MSECDLAKMLIQNIDNMEEILKQMKNRARSQDGVSNIVDLSSSILDISSSLSALSKHAEDLMKEREEMGECLDEDNIS